MLRKTHLGKNKHEGVRRSTNQSLLHLTTTCNPHNPPQNCSYSRAVPTHLYSSFQTRTCQNLAHNTGSGRLWFASAEVGRRKRNRGESPRCTTSCEPVPLGVLHAQYYRTNENQHEACPLVRVVLLERALLRSGVDDKPLRRGRSRLRPLPPSRHVLVARQLQGVVRLVKHFQAPASMQKRRK